MKHKNYIQSIKSRYCDYISSKDCARVVIVPTRNNYDFLIVKECSVITLGYGSSFVKGWHSYLIKDRHGSALKPFLPMFVQFESDKIHLRFVHPKPNCINLSLSHTNIRASLDMIGQSKICAFMAVNLWMNKPFDCLLWHTLCHCHSAQMCDKCR